MNGKDYSGVKENCTNSLHISIISVSRRAQSKIIMPTNKLISATATYRTVRTDSLSISGARLEAELTGWISDDEADGGLEVLVLAPPEPSDAPPVAITLFDVVAAAVWRSSTLQSVLVASRMLPTCVQKSTRSAYMLRSTGSAVAAHAVQ